MDPHLRADRARDVAQVPVVAEVDHLSRFAHVGEQAERLFGAKVVEGLENVVGNERNRSVPVDELPAA